MFGKCILHVGTEKTGTTSIQEFLLANKKHLAKQRLFIPETMGRSEHVDLVCLFADPEKRFSRRKRLGIRNVAQAKAHQKELYGKVSKELKKNARPEKTLIISTERLFTEITNEHELEGLIAFLKEYCLSIEALFYIRPQHEFAISIFSTALKGGRVIGSILPDINAGDSSSKKYLYWDVLNFWRNALGHENIRVRRFSRQHLRNGNVVFDFAENLGIDLENLTMPQKINQSLSWQAQAFLVNFNPYIQSVEKKNPVGRGNINKILENNYAGSGMLPTKRETEAFFHQFKDCNEKIRSEWFPDDEVLFHTNFDKYPENPPAYELTLEEHLKIFSKIYQVHVNKINKLMRVFNTI